MNDRTKSYDGKDKEANGSGTEPDVCFQPRENTDRVRATTWKLGQWIDIGDQQVFDLEDMR